MGTGQASDPTFSPRYASDQPHLLEMRWDVSQLFRTFNTGDGTCKRFRSFPMVDVRSRPVGLLGIS